MVGILKSLSGGDQRFNGQSNVVAAAVLANPSLLDELFGGLTCDDHAVSARAADALEKVSGRHPEWLQKYKAALLGEISTTAQPAVRWHVAQIIPRLVLSDAERKLAFALFVSYLSEPGSIVKTAALQGIFDLSHGDSSLQPVAQAILQEALRSGTPAMKARARKLAKLNN